MAVITNTIPSCIMKIEGITGSENLGDSISNHDIFTLAGVSFALESPVMNKYLGIENKSNKLSSSCSVKVFKSEKYPEFITHMVQGKDIGNVTISILQTAGNTTNRPVCVIELKNVRICDVKVDSQLSKSDMPEEYQEFIMDEEAAKIMSSHPGDLNNKVILESLQAILSPKKFTGIIDLGFEYSEIILHYYVMEPNGAPRGHRSWGWNFNRNELIRTAL